MGLISHPPSDPQAAELIRSKTQSPPRVRPPPTNHAYGTRSSRTTQPAPSPTPSSLPLETKLLPGALEFSRIFRGSASRDVMRPPLTPPNSNPSSDPPSDGEQRIKRLGSIGSILSPVLPKAERLQETGEADPETEGDSDQSQVFYDASETLAS